MLANLKTTIHQYLVPVRIIRSLECPVGLSFSRRTVHLLVAHQYTFDGTEILIWTIKNMPLLEKHSKYRPIEDWYLILEEQPVCRQIYQATTLALRWILENDRIFD